jgi:alkylated DNA repair protein (DNA oxidative demethylase)
LVALAATLGLAARPGRALRLMTEGPAALDLKGVRIVPGLLDPTAQAALLEELRALVAAAPLVTHSTPRGKPLSVRMTAAGRFGWVSDRKGYRYADRHPSGREWPPIPQRLLDLWALLVPGARAPECCLVNFYGEGARMGLHQDRDEADLTQPVVSLSLGDDGLFRVGGTVRGGPTRSCWLRSGDAAVLEGPARLAFHGVDRIRFGSSTLLRDGGRINLTLRVVT